MKPPFYIASFALLSFLTIFLVNSCNVLLKDCGKDVVLGEYQSSAIARSFLPNPLANTLVYTNGNEELTMSIHDGLKSTEYTMPVCEICYKSSIPDESYEVAKVEKQKVNYVFSHGLFAYSITIDFGNQKEFFYGSYDSAYIYEYILISINAQNLANTSNRSTLGFKVNDVQNEAESIRLKARFIQDTVLNNVHYSQVYTNEDVEEIYYSKGKGVVAFEYLDEMWYLKE